MADILLRHYLWSILVFTFFIVGGVSMIAEFNEVNPSLSSSDKYVEFNESFNQFAEVTNTVSGIETGITEAETDFGAFGVLNALISSSWQSLKLMFTSFSIMDDAYDGLAKIFGLPAWIPVLIGLAVTILIGFLIYSAIFQTQL